MKTHLRITANIQYFEVKIGTVYDCLDVLGVSLLFPEAMHLVHGEPLGVCTWSKLWLLKTLGCPLAVQLEDNRN